MEHSCALGDCPTGDIEGNHAGNLIGSSASVSHCFPFGFLRGRSQNGLLHFGQVRGSSAPRRTQWWPHRSHPSSVTVIRISRRILGCTVTRRPVLKLDGIVLWFRGKPIDTNSTAVQCSLLLTPGPTHSARPRQRDGPRVQDAGRP